jgi:hypothetical protein
MRMKGIADLTDVQWEYVESFVKWEREQRQRSDGRGLPHFYLGSIAKSEWAD